MQFLNYGSLPQAVKEIMDKRDFVGYVRVYYRGRRYGSRLFFKDEDTGKIKEIQMAEKRSLKRYTEEMRNALQSVCETLFEENCPRGRMELYDFCKKNGFDETEHGYVGFCCMEHSAFEVLVSKEDGYFCRVFFYEI